MFFKQTPKVCYYKIKIHECIFDQIDVIKGKCDIRCNNLPTLGKLYNCHNSSLLSNFPATYYRFNYSMRNI
jgi:hypothetical protein